jgi:PiT family inorganic phosphate transporter
VAKTIASGFADPELVTQAVVLAALVGAIVWNLFTWWRGIPSSSSHALVGGIVGAVIAGSGPSAVQAAGLWKIAVALFTSPILGFVAGIFVMRATLRAAQGATPRANQFFKVAQIPTALALALGHGANDAQKTRGVITLGLVVLGFQPAFHVPWWVVLLSASAIASGTALGGWRIIHTLGGKFYRIRPIHSFSSQLASASVIATASLLGGPVSTTQVVSSAILGVGAAERKSQVRWGVLTDILTAWFLTVPATAVVAALLYVPIAYLVR